VRKDNFSKWAKASADLGRFETTRTILAEWGKEYPGTAPAFSPPAKGEPFYEAAAHLKIAIEAARAERTVDAEAHFRRSLAIEPSYEDAQYNFAMFLGLHGRPREALHLYFIVSGGGDRPGPAAECALLSVIARAFWDRGEQAQARDAVALALARAGQGAEYDSLRRQAQEYGAQTLPALRDSTIR
jgi:tetratricopeptide (TPR) repeat protein